MDDARSVWANETCARRLPVLNAAAAERDTEQGVTVSPGCCAAGSDTQTRRRVKTSWAIALFVSCLFAPLDW